MVVHLFHAKGELRDFLENEKHLIKSEIENYGKKLLNVNEEELVRYLINKYKKDPPVLKEKEKYICHDQECDIDISNDPLRKISDRSRPFHIKGVLITIAIPFDGDPNLFYYKPSEYTYNPPEGEVIGQEVRLTYKTAEYDKEALEKSITNDINCILKYLKWVHKDIMHYNESLKPFIRKVIRNRKEKLQKDMELVTSLGIPIKKREGMPKTYAVPEIRRKPRISKPQPPETALSPEPALDIHEYDNILNIIRSMALVIEKSPSAFSTMKEEDLRNHFLVQLNAQYEGMATGETFNYEGKTDILIKYKGKNVFIAECKFWDGEKSLLSAIDQLLNYTCWRDTKTAILLFCKRKNFSEILNKIPDVVKSHPCCKNGFEIKGETEFRFLFHHRDDPDRELILTVMAYHVPTIKK